MVLIKHNRRTQLLNCQWNSSDIDTCQRLKYQSSQSYNVYYLLDLSFWSWGSREYVCLWFWWLIFQHLTCVNRRTQLLLNPESHSCFPMKNWLYSVTQLPVEFQWHWHVSNAEISIIRTTNVHILMNLMIKMINLIGVISYMTVMTDILVLDTCQCHWNSTGNWATE